MLKRFESAAKSSNLHTYRLPASNSKGGYTNPDGQDLAPCQYCRIVSVLVVSMVQKQVL